MVYKVHKYENISTRCEHTKKPQQKSKCPSSSVQSAVHMLSCIREFYCLKFIMLCLYCDIFFLYIKQIIQYIERLSLKKSFSCSTDVLILNVTPKSAHTEK